MTESDSPTKLPGLVYTFYSYKGGVGRSMALVNVGVLMATEGYRILLVDWDLEAPGLEMFFRKAARLSRDPTSTPGIVDLLDAHAQSTTLSWRECLLQAEFFGKSLDILSAGRRTDDYRRRVQQLDWATLFREHRIGNYINTLREEWRKGYDFVLVDSRTGITDIGDICTVILPDVLVLLFVTNHQNVEGIKSVMARAVKARAKLPVNRNKLLGVPVPARDERDRESDKFEEWKQIFASEFNELYREWLPIGVNPSDALHRIYIPYVAGWSFGERIPVIESDRERSDPSSLGAAYARVATLLSHRLDWSAIEGKASAADVLGTRVELSKARAEAREAEGRIAQLEQTARRARIWRWASALFILVLVGSGSWWYVTHPTPARLVARLKSPDASVRWQAVADLGLMAITDQSLSRFAPDVIPLLKDQNTLARSFAATTLARMGVDGAKFAPEIAELLKDESPQVRSRAAAALGKMGKPVAKFAPAVAALLNDTDPDVRKAAAEALKQMGEEGLLKKGQ